MHDLPGEGKVFLVALGIIGAIIIMLLAVSGFNTWLTWEDVDHCFYACSRTRMLTYSEAGCECAP